MQKVKKEEKDTCFEFRTTNNNQRRNIKSNDKSAVDSIFVYRQEEYGADSL